LKKQPAGVVASAIEKLTDFLERNFQLMRSEDRWSQRTAGVGFGCHRGLVRLWPSTIIGKRSYRKPLERLGEVSNRMTLERGFLDF
jgi:hypothetical protein